MVRCLCLSPVAAKQAWIITTSSPYVTVGMKCFCWCSVFVFHQMWDCALKPNISTLASFVQSTLFCVLWFAQMHDVLLERRGFLLATNKPLLFTLFLNVLSWTVISDMLTEVFNVALGVFCVLPEHGTVSPWGIFAVTSTPWTPVTYP